MSKLKWFVIIILAVLLCLVLLENKKLNTSNTALSLANKTLKENENLRVEVDKGNIIVLSRTQNAENVS